MRSQNILKGKSLGSNPTCSWMRYLEKGRQCTNLASLHILSKWGHNEGRCCLSNKRWKGTRLSTVHLKSLMGLSIRSSRIHPLHTCYNYLCIHQSSCTSWPPELFLLDSLHQCKIHPQREKSFRRKNIHLAFSSSGIALSKGNKSNQLPLNPPGRKLHMCRCEDRVCQKEPSRSNKFHPHHTKCRLHQSSRWTLPGPSEQIHHHSLHRPSLHCRLRVSMAFL